MDKYRFKIERSLVGGTSDTAWVNEDQDIVEELVKQVVDDLGVEINVTVSGITMHLSAWIDPEHWAEEWREHCGDLEPTDYVAELLAQAKEDE